MSAVDGKGAGGRLHKVAGAIFCGKHQRVQCVGDDNRGWSRAYRLIVQPPAPCLDAAQWVGGGKGDRNGSCVPAVLAHGPLSSDANRGRRCVVFEGLPVDPVGPVVDVSSLVDQPEQQAVCALAWRLNSVNLAGVGHEDAVCSGLRL